MSMAIAQSDPTRLFISGHSLVNQPLPDFLTQIAKSKGVQLQWHLQYQVGSTLTQRSQGKDGLPVLAEPSRFDAMLVTERHDLLWSLTENNTIHHLVNFHEQLIKGNPKGNSYFFEPWLGVNDKSQPERWIAYERAASPIWQCAVTRVNASLQAQGISSQMHSIPAGAALADLIDHATHSSGLANITVGQVRQTVDSLFHDDVHLTELGNYYVALVTFSHLYRASPVGAWHPLQVTGQQALTLQQAALSFTTRHRQTHTPLSLETCRATLQDNFVAQYWSYFRDTYWLREVNPVIAYWRWARQRVQWHWRVWRNKGNYPF